MHVALDYWPAVTHAPGVGRYARELVRALVRLEECPQLTLFDLGPGPREIPKAALGLEQAPERVRRVSAPIPRRVLAGIESVTGLGADRMMGGCDLFHRMFHDRPPVGDVPQVLSVSELPPEGSREEERLAHSLAHIGDLIAMSRHAGRELERRFGLAPERVHVLPVGSDHWVRELSAPVPRADPPVLLVLGRRDARRRPLEILRGFEALRARGVDARLEFSGGRGDASRDMDQAVGASRFANAVERHSSPAELELPKRVARASVLVHLSDEELTPVTPLEALACGVPAVVSRLPAFEEELGAEAQYVDDLAPDALAEAFERALAATADPEAQARRRALAAAHTWERAARATLDVWRAMVER